MAEQDINRLLHKIASEPYGKNMRSYIIQAIRLCYDDGSSGAEDLTARGGINTLTNKIGSSDISTIDSEATNITKALLAINDKFEIHYKPSNPETVRVGIHDWLIGYFNTSEGISYVNFRVPLIKVVGDRSYFRSEDPDHSGITMAWTPGSSNTEFRSIGLVDLLNSNSDGWRATAISKLNINGGQVRTTYNRAALWVTIPLLVSSLQPDVRPCFVSSDITFTFVGYTGS